MYSAYRNKVQGGRLIVTGWKPLVSNHPINQVLFILNYWYSILQGYGGTIKMLFLWNVRIFKKKGISYDNCTKMVEILHDIVT